MSATRNRRNGSAPATAPAPEQETAPETAPEQEQEAPETAPAFDIAGAVASEEIGKGARVYIDVPGVPRVPTADAGTLAAVQREQRADGSLGEYLLAEIRKGKTGAPDSVQRFSIARVQALKTALESAGVTTLR